MKISLALAFLGCVLLCCACANSRARGGTAETALTCNLPAQTVDYQPPSQPDYPQVLAAPGPF